MGLNRKQDNGRFVLPGESLGVIEEFMPNIGTYVKDGVIHSKVIGLTSFDLLNKRASVCPLAVRTKVPSAGSVVIGQVLNVQTQVALVRIFKVDGKDISGSFTGLLHISNVQIRYVGSMFNVCKPGDVLRAKAISEKNRVYHLSIKDKGLGVIHALCSRCGYILEPRGRNMLCSRCGSMERRKMAVDYGVGAI